MGAVVLEGSAQNLHLVRQYLQHELVHILPPELSVSSLERGLPLFVRGFQFLRDCPLFEVNLGSLSLEGHFGLDGRGQALDVGG